jgi:hypothetical protein
MSLLGPVYRMARETTTKLGLPLLVSLFIRDVELIKGIAAYDTLGNNASGIDWLTNSQNAQYLMSRYWANSTAEVNSTCGGG